MLLRIFIVGITEEPARNASYVTPMVLNLIRIRFCLTGYEAMDHHGISGWRLGPGLDEGR